MQRISGRAYEARELCKENADLVADLKKGAASAAQSSHSQKRLSELEAALSKTQAQLDSCNGLLAHTEKTVKTVEVQRAKKEPRIGELTKHVRDANVKFARAVRDSKEAIGDVERSIAREGNARVEVWELTKEVELL